MKTATVASLASAMVFLTLAPAPASATYHEWREWTSPGDEYIMGYRSDFAQYLQFPQISVANRQQMARAGHTLFTKAYPFVNQKVRLWDAQFKADFGNQTTVHPGTRMQNLGQKAANMTEKDFQYEFSHIFSSMGDRHTFYSFPMPHSCVSATLGLVYKYWGQYQVAVEGAIPLASITNLMGDPASLPLRNRTHIITAYDGVNATTFINRKRWEMYGMQPSTITPFFGARLIHADGMISQLPDKSNMVLTFNDPSNAVPSYSSTLNWIFGVKRSCISTYHELSGTPNPYLVKRASNPIIPISVPAWQRIPASELPESGTPLAFTQFRNSIFNLPPDQVVDPMDNIIPSGGNLQKRHKISIPYTDVPGFRGIMGWKIDTDPITGLPYSLLKINAFVFPGRFNEMVLTIRNLILTELSRTPYLVIDLSDNPGGFIGSGQALVQLIANVEILPHYNYMLNEQPVINFVSNGRNTRILTGDALMNQYENTTFVYDRNDWEKKRVEYNQFGRVWSQVSVIGGNAQTGSTAGMTAAMALEAGIPRLNLNGNSADSASQFGWYSGLRATSPDWPELPQTFKDAPPLLRQEMYLSLTRMKGQSEFNEGELSGLPWEDRPNAELANFLPLAIYRSADKIARVNVNRLNYSVTDYLTGAISGSTISFNLNVTNRDGIVGFSSSYGVSASAPAIPTLSGTINHNSPIRLNVTLPASIPSTTTRFNFAVNGTSTVLLVDIGPARSQYYPLSITNPLVQGGTANFSNPTFNPWIGLYRKFIADPIPAPSADNRTLVFFNERGDRGRTHVSFFTRAVTAGRISGRFNYTAGSPFPVAEKTTLSLTVYYNTTLVASLPLDKTFRSSGTVASYDSVSRVPANTHVEFRITYDSNTRWDYGYFQLNSVNVNLL